MFNRILDTLNKKRDIYFILMAICTFVPVFDIGPEVLHGLLILLSMPLVLICLALVFFRRS